MIKGSLSIARVSSNVREMDGMMHITLQDSNYLKVVDMVISPEDLMLALTGRSQCPVEFDLGKMDLIGKTQEQQTVDIPIPDYLYVRKDIEEYIKNNYLDVYEQDGWILDTSLTSQRSTSKDGEGQTWAHVKRTRYV